MKKVSTIMALLLCSGLAQARTYDEIINSGFLKIGVPADYAPLAFYNSQEKLVGFDVDMAKELAKRLNVTPVFYLTSWPTLSQDLANDNYDVAMGGVTYTRERAEKFLLSDEIVKNGKVALAACEVASKLSNLDKIDQPGVKVVVNPGGTNESFVNNNIHTAQVIRVENNFDNIQALRDKKADLMVTDLIEGQYYQYKEPNVLCLATNAPFKGTESYKAYMVQLGNQKLLDVINSWLPHSNKQQLAVKWGVKTQLN
ncbi:transporter substrate-binding domain-containing protein [Gilliamella sp. B2840]|uniref:transporter substrate-binding domain-containing protein n=1 Tax=unclassified Gilliamella TaxID=2685620 RepID=UPI00226A7BC4|nr:MULTISPECIES: transporter substrate-binding domain-containing protein [unclassified Gilliamella]MCX8656512.1 transporter substrate-binding domain-containing protein [Gilliamella sp. B2894]MCX8664985.1 transporter substrate-binding domain-containing protein [Gilliamella sp. B2887]MCX8692933.1 transporter substrate-binding domain-containing protein [Gilliamella sp. B2881]MCX8696282.1 transporter substrate-binding domain-containing protein [Gilliamella sp. B2828]MCX8697581.1 transporter substr